MSDAGTRARLRRQAALDKRGLPNDEYIARRLDILKAAQGAAEGMENVDSVTPYDIVNIAQFLAGDFVEKSE